MTKHLVVIVTHNYAAYVGQAIDCVRKQTETDWHCTIVDNGSTDDTVRIARAECAGDPRFKIIEKANEGPSAGRNVGYRHSAPSEYITFLDGDDLLAPTFLERLGGHLDAHPECGLVSCQFDRMTSAGEHMDGGFRSRIVPGLFSFPRQMKSSEIVTPFVAFFSSTGQGHFSIFRASVFGRTTLYEESYWSHEDSDIFCQMSLLAEVHALPDRLYRRREHGLNLTRSGRSTAEEFRRKWDFYDLAHPETAHVIGPARRYYYRRHEPLRDFKVALMTLKGLLRKPAVKEFKWMLYLIRHGVTLLVVGERHLKSDATPRP
ncbi:MAG: glycosyltransferase family 2 protein [Variovorax sp.]|nr:glycosyltransferase family 2 protein [Variovorax sp.]